MHQYHRFVLSKIPRGDRTKQREAPFCSLSLSSLDPARFWSVSPGSLYPCAPCGFSFLASAPPRTGLSKCVYFRSAHFLSHLFSVFRYCLHCTIQIRFRSRASSSQIAMPLFGASVNVWHAATHGRNGLDVRNLFWLYSRSHLLISTHRMRPTTTNNSPPAAVFQAWKIQSPSAPGSRKRD